MKGTVFSLMCSLNTCLQYHTLLKLAYLATPVIFYCLSNLSVKYQHHLVVPLQSFQGGWVSPSVSRWIVKTLDHRDSAGTINLIYLKQNYNVGNRANQSSFLYNQWRETDAVSMKFIWSLRYLLYDKTNYT